MRRQLLCLIPISLALWQWAGQARADQRRDYMLDFAPEGTFFVTDYFGTGAQLSLEHLLPIYSEANDLTLGASTLLAYPLGEVTTRADLRILFLRLGVTAAYRTVWRNLRFEPGADGGYCSRCDRKARRLQDPLFSNTDATDRWYWLEGRAQLLMPMNEYFVLASLIAGRHEDRRRRSYDWFFAHIHDGGMVYRWETVFFLKHSDWGGIGPFIQNMWLPRAGKSVSKLALGFNAVTRLGLIRRDDLLFLTFLIRPGDDLYGQHAYYSPVRALIIYRMTLTL